MNHPINGSHSGVDASNGQAKKLVLLSATSIVGDNVCNLEEETLGTIEDLMLDLTNGSIRYAVLSTGGFLGMGDRLVAIPWKALRQDGENKRFILDIDAKRMKNAPGFDKNDWPNMADSTWNSSIQDYYTMRTDSRAG